MGNFYNRARMFTSMFARVYEGLVYKCFLKEASRQRPPLPPTKKGMRVFLRAGV